MIVSILPYTTKNPLMMIGNLAGICYASDSDKDKLIARALNCIEQKHDRVLEFPVVYMKIEEVSAKTLRELYTHIGGSPTRLQESTRYVDYEKNFDYVVPITIDTAKKNKIWTDTMIYIHEAMTKLKELGVPKEDYSNLLPLAYASKMVWKVNLRTLVNFFNQRLCGKAYPEMRNLAGRIKYEIASYSDEWKIISDKLFLPKCSVYGKCTEKVPCDFKKF